MRRINIENKHNQVNMAVACFIEGPAKRVPAVSTPSGPRALPCPALADEKDALLPLASGAKARVWPVSNADKRSFTDNL
ncbi:protein of unknown function (plasmid) [Methylocella tundrae]|uniref:Uncharacterized protein n=1 Tax=Methylocella tundrae TaxID=227605 RepID=A0A4U8Z869_METTU|nr:protein of unknown function [Methylocella tundrae]